MDILSGQLHALTSSSKKALGFGFLVGLATRFGAPMQV